MPRITLVIGIAGTLFFNIAAQFSYAQENTADNESFDSVWDDDWGEDTYNSTKNINVAPFSGFTETLYGSRLSNSEFHKKTSIEDIRLRLETKLDIYSVNIVSKGDIYYDGVLDDWRGNFRELRLDYSWKQTDLKVGRQVLTWGTGDFLFLNDFFPKDWQSFFSGRDDEYLKASSNAVKLSLYSSIINTDFVWVPKFEPDNYVRGDYYSFFNPLSNSISAPNLEANEPDNSEFAIRLFKTINSYELGGYFYRGYFKSPNGFSEQGELEFSRLQSLGFSVRGQAGDGLINVETSYLNSLDDKEGNDPLISNSQFRFLIGYEQELRERLTASTQIYLERTLKYNQLIESSFNTTIEPNENRTLLTLRLGWRSRNDKLRLSLFTFYSPSDSDSYWRPSVNYRVNDHWNVSFGGNVFEGKDENTFFSQLDDNENLFLRVRYNY